MLRLILMRHAKSDWSLGGDDFARPLNERGRDSADALGDWLRMRGYLPDEVLCSASARTRETFDRLKIDAPLTSVNAMYLASENTLFDTLQGARGKTVLMIAHNPGIAAFAACLVATPPDHDRFDDYPTGATLVADFAAEEWGALRPHSGTAVDFVVPRDL